MPFKRGDIVEYHAVDPRYEDLNGHTGMITDIVEHTNYTDYTVAWFTNISARFSHAEAEAVASGWGESVLRYVTHVDVPV